MYKQTFALIMCVLLPVVSRAMEPGRVRLAHQPCRLFRPPVSQCNDCLMGGRAYCANCPHCQQGDPWHVPPRSGGMPGVRVAAAPERQAPQVSVAGPQESHEDGAAPRERGSDVEADGVDGQHEPADVSENAESVGADEQRDDASVAREQPAQQADEATADGTNSTSQAPPNNQPSGGLDAKKVKVAVGASAGFGGLVMIVTAYVLWRHFRKKRAVNCQPAVERQPQVPVVRHYPPRAYRPGEQRPYARQRGN